MDWLQFHGTQTPTRFSMDIKNVHTIHGKIVWKKVRNAKLNSKDAAGNESGATVPDLLVKTCWDRRKWWDRIYTPKKLTWHWNIPIFNRKYIFKWWIFHCYVSFPGGTPSSLFGSWLMCFLLFNDCMVGRCKDQITDAVFKLIYWAIWT